MFVAVSFAACASGTPSQQVGAAPNLGAFAPTPIEVVERMLELAEVTKDDVVYDLGSGDGRIVIMAAKRYEARGVGVEIDPLLVWFSNRSAKREGVTRLVRFLHQDALTVELSQATVVTLYLTQEANLLLRPILQVNFDRGPAWFRTLITWVTGCRSGSRRSSPKAVRSTSSICGASTSSEPVATRERVGCVAASEAQASTLLTPAAVAGKVAAHSDVRTRGTGPLQMTRRTTP
jgi:SAM-dependent methyltransferase